MKDVFLLYDTCCLYEIVILNYFMKVTQCDIVFCSLDGKTVNAAEGYSINVDTELSKLELQQIRSFIIPGGNIDAVNNEEVKRTLCQLRQQGTILAGICAGVDLLEKAEILKNIKSIHSEIDDVVNDHRVITSRANGYVDFAIEVAKELQLFTDESDLQETIDFWKYHKRMD